MDIQSPAFEDGGQIPQLYTCQGKDRSPPLRIRNVPDDAASLALVVEDPDAPGGRFVHWLMWNLPADSSDLPESLAPEPTLDGLGRAAQGSNDFRQTGWRGPCPPPGSPHHYRFQLFALDTRLDVEPGADRDAVQEAMDGHVLDAAELTGLYGR